MRDKPLIPYIMAVFYAVLVLASVLLVLIDRLMDGFATQFISSRIPMFGLTLLILFGSVVALQIGYTHLGGEWPKWMTDDKS